MGSLALWGAVAGAGEGWGKGVVLEAQSRENDLDRKHQSKLAELQIKADNDRELTRQKFESEAQTERLEAQEALVGKEEQYRRDIADQTTATTLSEGAANRGIDREQMASAERIAGMRADASDNSGSRFTFSQETVKVMDPDSGVMQENISSLASDKKTGMRFYQDGDKMIPVTRDPKTNTNIAMPVSLIAPPEVVELLYKNPEQLGDFIDGYHYVPAQFFQLNP